MIHFDEATPWNGKEEAYLLSLCNKYDIEVDRRRIIEEFLVMYPNNRTFHSVKNKLLRWKKRGIVGNKQSSRVVEVRTGDLTPPRRSRDEEIEKFTSLNDFNVSETLRKIRSVSGLENEVNKIGTLISSLNKDYHTLKEKNQRMGDALLKERGLNRTTYRSTYIIEENLRDINASLELRNEQVSKFVHYHNSEQIGNASNAIMHLSDIHFNELINTFGNKYDFTIANTRLHYFTTKCLSMFSSVGVKNVYVLLTGDIINSDRRKEEKLYMATTRGSASVIASEILEQVLLHVNSAFNVKFSYVSGNESRFEEEHGYSDKIATDNFDFIVGSMLEKVFKNTPGIEYIDGNGDNSERIVRVGSKNILILHGDTLTTKIDQSIRDLRDKYASLGVLIDYVIFGHIHAAYLSDFFSRSSGLCGGNDYSEKRLRLGSKPSQNAIIINDSTGTIDSIKIDLHGVEHFHKGRYNIDHLLKRYNVIGV